MSEGEKEMIGIKRTTYSLLNDETGQVFKERFLKTHDVINVKEDDQLIVITVGETFDTNEFMWV